MVLKDLKFSLKPVFYVRSKMRTVELWWIFKTDSSIFGLCQGIYIYIFTQHIRFRARAVISIPLFCYFGIHQRSPLTFIYYFICIYSIFAVIRIEMGLVDVSASAYCYRNPAVDQEKNKLNHSFKPFDVHTRNRVTLNAEMKRKKTR